MLLELQGRLRAEVARQAAAAAAAPARASDCLTTATAAAAAATTAAALAIETAANADVGAGADGGAGALVAPSRAPQAQRHTPLATRNRLGGDGAHDAYDGAYVGGGSSLGSGGDSGGGGCGHTIIAGRRRPYPFGDLEDETNDEIAGGGSVGRSACRPTFRGSTTFPNMGGALGARKHVPAFGATATHGHTLSDSGVSIGTGSGGSSCGIGSGGSSGSSGGIVIGGIGSVRGAFYSAMIVGLIDTAGRAFLPMMLREFLDRSTAQAAGPALASMLTCIFMAAVLALKPAGLFPVKNQ